MELSEPPSGPIPDDHAQAETACSEQLEHKSYADTLLEETVDCLEERLLSSSSPLPENCGALFQAHTARLETLQREAWFCHWGVVVSLCVYQQLISHVEIKIRESIAQSLGAFLAEGGQVDNTQLYNLIETEFKKHSIALKPDMEHIHRELACTALHSTVVCFMRDIALSIHAGRVLGADRTLEAMFPASSACISRHFFMRFATISSALLDILYDVMPWLQSFQHPVMQLKGIGPA